MNIFNTRYSLCALVIVILSCLLFSCGKKKYRHCEGMIWNTAYHITYCSDRDLTDSILKRLNEADASLNVFNPHSLVSRVNSNESVRLDLHFLKVYETSQKINELTGGAFDPTLEPLITAWGFGRGHRATSDTLHIDSLLLFTGIEKTRIFGNILLKQDPRTRFNFSAIAKGYGCDAVAEMLETTGIGDYLVEIGGEIRCAGKSPSGGKWKISIDKPIMSDTITHDSQCVIEFTDMGLATSGNYRNFHRTGSGAYGHTISAKTGRPARTDVISVTVAAATAMEADALATAFMALGSEESMKLAESIKLPVMLVMADMSTLETPQFTSLIVSEP